MVPGYANGSAVGSGCALRAARGLVVAGDGGAPRRRVAAPPVAWSVALAVEADDLGRTVADMVM